MTNQLLAIASIFEAVPGLVLIIAPRMARLLLGIDISGAAVGITRVAGAGLLVLGIACWPRVQANIARARAMLIYNVLATAYLAYLRIASELVGKLLFPALAVHAVLAVLF
jgi:hypothetical protein